VTTALTTALASAEDRIKDGAMAMAQSLQLIRDQKLYSVKGYSSFDEYCRKEWNYTPQWVSLQIGAAETRHRIASACGDETAAIPISNERQLRVLKDVEDCELEAVIDEAAEIAAKKGSKVTAAVLSRAKAKVLGVTPKQPSEPKRQPMVDRPSAEQLAKSKRLALEGLYALVRHLGILGIGGFDSSLQQCEDELEAVK